MSADASAAIHPKMKRRYAEVKKESGRKRLRILTTGAVLLALVLFAALVLLSPIANIDRIVMHGVPNNLLNPVKEASTIRKGQPLVFVRAHEVARGIETVPEVLSARVQVHWPHEVEVFVKLRTPVVVVKADERFIPVSGDGIVLNSVSKIVPPAVLVHGAGQIAKPGRTAAGELLGAAEFVNGLRPETRAKINSLTIDQGQLSVIVRLNSKGSIATFLLGPPTEMDAKAVAVDTMLAGAKLLGGDTINVTAPRSPLVVPFKATTPVTTPKYTP